MSYLGFYKKKGAFIVRKSIKRLSNYFLDASRDW